MTVVTSIRSRQIITCSDEELCSVIGACLGGKFGISESGEWSLEPWEAGETDAGRLFRVIYIGRRFDSLTSVAACVLDLQIEQLDLASLDKA